MRFQLLSFAVSALPVLAAAAPSSPFNAGDQEENAGLNKRSFEMIDGVNHTRFEHAATGSVLSFVTNSGICETTPGVNSYSGYLSVGTNMNMWFWFFEARNNPTTAPLATWFNGGPGCSSMIGLFQENGPCHFVNGESTPSLNPYSFNEYANMLYIDQPIGVGFSYGTNDVDSTVEAAPYVWKLIQAFYDSFPEYENRDFGLFTESYGGHYGPEFASYIQSQNAAIAKGTVTGQNISIVALGINNGWFDAKIQYKSYIDFSYNNTYKSLISNAEHTTYLNTYNTKCLPLLEKCTSLTGADAACEKASDDCYQYIEGPLSSIGDFDVYDIRAPSDDPNPPTTYSTYLKDKAVLAAIGAKSTYQECADDPYYKFEETGDNARSLLATLSSVVESGISVLIWAGDSDWICNWYGGLESANAISYSGTAAFNAKAVADYTVNGVVAGTFKSVANLSWLRVFGAGHEVMFYQPEISLQAFKQTMQKKPISST